MLRSTASKIMWVGRATVFLVGLAVILALVLGVASAAFGANGQNFILGQLNKATAITQLNGNVSGGPALRVNNTRTDGGSGALQLGVAQGKPPIVVNATAGKAPNLNADKLDGKDSTALLPGGDLPTGRTIRGSYDIREYVNPSSHGVDTSVISFGYRLSSAPTVRIIKDGATKPAECPGTVSSPEAAPGNLCVYESFGTLGPGYPYDHNVTRNGATLVAYRYNSFPSDYVQFATRGTWAVTGN